MPLALLMLLLLPAVLLLPRLLRLLPLLQLLFLLLPLNLLRLELLLLLVLLLLLLPLMLQSPTPALFSLLMLLLDLQSSFLERQFPRHPQHGHLQESKTHAKGQVDMSFFVAACAE